LAVIGKTKTERRKYSSTDGIAVFGKDLYKFIYDLIDEAISISDYIALIDWVHECSKY
jgi:hypothetical protein